MKPHRMLRWHATVAVLVALVPMPARAWQSNGSPVCSAPFNQSSPAVVRDGSGGVIIVWHDQRGGTFLDVYAQRLTATGALAPSWPVNGRAVCTALQDQANPMVVGDGAGGAIITWQDLRTFTSYDIFAQHVLPSGDIDPLWPSNGTPICTAAVDQIFPQIVGDGAGGAIIAWVDSRAGGPTPDIYAQHLKSTGVVDPAWPADGRALCTAANEQEMLRLVSDGAGGAIATWLDFRDGASYDIYAHRVLASGAVDPAWPADGVPVCVAELGQFFPAIVADGAGGAIITWEDFRSAGWDIYAQHVLSSGVRDPAWPLNGRGVCLSLSDQRRPEIASDGAGGAIVTWFDARGVDFDIYAHHVLANGTLDPLSPANGVPVCVATNIQSFPQVASDGSGGAMVTWQDVRSGNDLDVYATHLLSTGAPDPGWPANGAPLSVAAKNQNGPVIAADGNGGAFVAWVDSRGTDIDIYAQHVPSNGDVVSVPGEAQVTRLEMLAPFPNPARGQSVDIPFVLPTPSRASVEVFDLAGQRVRALALDRELPSGRQVFEWDGRSDAHEHQPSGVYFVRIRAGATSMTRRLILFL